MQRSLKVGFQLLTNQRQIKSGVQQKIENCVSDDEGKLTSELVREVVERWQLIVVVRVAEWW